MDKFVSKMIFQSDCKVKLYDLEDEIEELAK
jgi:hypothetical protein